MDLVECMRYSSRSYVIFRQKGFHRHRRRLCQSGRVCHQTVIAVIAVTMLFNSSGFLSRTVQLAAKLLAAEKSLHCFTLEEVGYHDNYHDCWVVLFDKVYDLTEFIQIHPGGETVILEHAGRDATLTFLSSGHGEAMMATLHKYLVGTLPSHQQLFTMPQRPQ